METFIRIDESKGGIITHINSRPFDPVYGMGKSRNELLKEGYLVNDFPDPKLVEGKRPVPYYDAYKKEVTYKYIAIPDSAEDRMGYIEGALNEFLLSYQKNHKDLNDQVTETQIALCDVYELISSLVKKGKQKMAEYFAKQIIAGKLKYTEVIELYPEYKEEIDSIIKKYS